MAPRPPWSWRIRPGRTTNLELRIIVHARTPEMLADRAAWAAAEVQQSLLGYVHPDTRAELDRQVAAYRARQDLGEVD